MNTYRAKHFRLEELVDRAIFVERGDRAWWLLRPDALMMLDRLRDVFGVITVNDWADGGSHTEAGLRLPMTLTGAKWSMHKYGGAFDPKFRDVTPAEVSARILARPVDFPLITTLEDVAKTVTWLHFDVRNHSRAGIWVVEPQL
jgi:hypothetical protein